MVRSKIFAQSSLEAPQELSEFAGHTLVFTQPAPEPDRVNEDVCAVFEFSRHSQVLLVADGVGGHAHGEEASALIAEQLKKQFAHPGIDPTNLREPILDGIEAANEILLKKGGGSATTVAILEIQKDVVRPYHVGDSSILITGQRGKIKFQSVSHSPAGYGMESGLVDEHEVRHGDFSHWVSNLVGSREMHITVGPQTKVAARDTVILCSDGLSDNLYWDEVIETIRKGGLNKVTNQLIKNASAKMQQAEGKPDDLTFILFRKTV